MDKYEIVSGQLRGESLAYLIGNAVDSNSEKILSTILMWDNGNWNEFPTTYSLVSTCILSDEMFVTASEFGDILLISSGSIEIEQPQIDEEDFYLREVREISNILYIVGLGSTILRRISANNWEKITVGLVDDADSIAFESIHGFSENEIYAVGWWGSIWVYKKNSWIKVESPTNLLLTKVLCAPNGKVYICGQEGIVLVGRDNRWDFVQTGDIHDDFFDMEWFDGKLFISSMNGIYTVNEFDELEEVEFTGGNPWGCHRLTSFSSMLWSMGLNNIVEFNGLEWKEINFNIP